MKASAPPHDWRSALDYERLAGIDRAGMMWEWLRRDDGYVAWYAAADHETGVAGASDPDRDPAQWGLHFR